MKRYHPTYASSYEPMYEEDDGEYVTYDDAIALARRVSVFAWMRGNGKGPQAEDIDAIIAEAEKSPNG